MRHGETIAMLLKDRAGGSEFLTFPNQVVSDVSVRRVVHLVFIFVVWFSELSVLWPVDATVFI